MKLPRVILKQVIASITLPYQLIQAWLATYDPFKSSGCDLRVSATTIMAQPGHLEY